MKVLRHELSEFDFYEAGNIALLNGQEGLHETEERLFKILSSEGFFPIVIDDLFNKPDRIKVLKLMDVETIILGTTGVYKEKREALISMFLKLNYMPKKAIFTMGEGYFWEFEDKVKMYKMMPLNFICTDVIITSI